MRIHHLNCGTMCPLSHPKLNRFLPQLNRLNLVCHCLLIETDDGLILVDTGMGLQDVRNQERYLSNFVLHQFAKPALDLEETAFMQVVKRGFDPKDVKHILVTHFDIDHVGGIADFPHATIHCLRKEWDGANTPSSMRARSRYAHGYWKTGHKIETYDTTGDKWFGLSRVQNLRNIDPSIYMVSLPGHTQGHAGFFIEHTEDILFAGDAFIQVEQLLNKRTLLPLKLYDKFIHEDLEKAQDTLEKLRQLHLSHPRMSIICSHDQSQYLEAKKK